VSANMKDRPGEKFYGPPVALSFAFHFRFRDDLQALWSWFLGAYCDHSSCNDWFATVCSCTATTSAHLPPLSPSPQPWPATRACAARLFAWRGDCWAPKPGAPCCSRRKPEPRRPLGRARHTDAPAPCPATPYAAITRVARPPRRPGRLDRLMPGQLALCLAVHETHTLPVSSPCALLPSAADLLICPLRCDLTAKVVSDFPTSVVCLQRR
jgi:hypothetical protein